MQDLLQKSLLSMLTAWGRGEIFMRTSTMATGGEEAVVATTKGDSMIETVTATRRRRITIDTVAVVLALAALDEALERRNLMDSILMGLPGTFR
jgi:hypothetical protein